MSYKCRICDFNDVEEENGICDFCAMGRDPYAEAMHENNEHVVDSLTEKDDTHKQPSASYFPTHGKRKRVLLNTGKTVDHEDNMMIANDTDKNSSVKIYQAGEVPTQPPSSETSETKQSENSSSNTTAPNILTSGVVKNVSTDKQRKYFIQKLFDTLFSGIPFTLDNDITMFQVFPDYTSTSTNALGYACDQVIVYGKINAGVVSENNDIEVYGHRDSNNNIVAQKMRNKATGTIIEPSRVLNAGTVWCMAIAIFAIISMILFSLGSEGIVWCIILVICLTNLPLAFKIVMGIFGMFFSFFKWMTGMK